MSDFKHVLTVTLNPAIDRIVEISGFHTGSDHRVQKGVSFAGGKGINVSRALKALGLKSIVAGFAGGANGQNLLRDLLLEGFEHHFVFIQGETRVNLTICDSRCKKVTRVIDVGPTINSKDLRSFRDKFSRLTVSRQWTVLSGRTINGAPKNFYQELTQTGSTHGGNVIIDASGDDLKAALKARPFLVRINREEAQAILKKKLSTAKEQRLGLQKLLELGAQTAIISLGSQGAVATDGKVFYEAVCPGVKSVHTVGAGDAMTAGFIAGYGSSEDFLAGLVAGVAAGTANCLCVKPGALQLTDFKKIFSKVKVKVL